MPPGAFTPGAFTPGGHIMDSADLYFCPVFALLSLPGAPSSSLTRLTQFVSGCTRNPIFNTCMSERTSDPTPSPTLSTSEVTELADSQREGRGEDEALEELDELDDDIFLDELGGEEDDDDEGELCRGSGEGLDPFYDRSPLFSVVGRLVRFQEPAGGGN